MSGHPSGIVAFLAQGLVEAGRLLLTSKGLKKVLLPFLYSLPLRVHVSKWCSWGHCALIEESPGVTPLESDMTSPALPRQRVPSIVLVPHTLP